MRSSASSSRGAAALYKGMAEMYDDASGPCHVQRAAGITITIGIHRKRVFIVAGGLGVGQGSSLP